MARVRAPAAAGTFYPEDPARLRAALQAAFADARAPEDEPAPKALIVPHAAYLYSGAVAASGYRMLERVKSGIHRIVLLGPCHFVPLRGVAMPEAEAFATPLGLVPVDDEACSKLRDVPYCVNSDLPHAIEHSLEVQLPFLQTLLDDFAVMPLVVGLARSKDVTEVIEALWGGEETVIIVSTDLSHHLDQESAAGRDRRTADAILALRHEAIGDTDACGAYALHGLLPAAERRGITPRLLDLRTSGDTGGDRDRVVGYGAFAFS